MNTTSKTPNKLSSPPPLGMPAHAAVAPSSSSGETTTSSRKSSRTKEAMVSTCFVCELPILSHQTWDTWTYGPGIGPNAINANDIFHEDCLHCYACNARLKQGNGSAKRLMNKIYCVLHFGDVTGSFGQPGDDFIAKLRDFKRQSLGCAEARRKSSTTLSFAVPVQACPGAPYCSKYPHDVKPTSGYWIECRGGANPINVSEVQSNQDGNGSGNEDEMADIEMTTHLLTGRAGSICKPPPTPTVEAVLTRGRLERQETVKSNQDQLEFSRADLQSPEERPQSKDDLELVRRHSMATAPFPNITITIVQPSSPPLSPPVTGEGSPSKKSPANSGYDDSGAAYSGDYGSTSAGGGVGYHGGGHTIDESTGLGSPSRRRSSISEDPFELISFEEEIFEKYFYGREHWNYFTNDEALGPVILSLKQENFSGRDQFRVLLRTISYSLHGMIPSSAIVADRYDREAVVRALGDEAGLKPALALGQLPSTPDELLKLDQVFVKSELKVGVIYVQGHQVNSEEAILGNKAESPLFVEFLNMLGERVRLKGFDKYKGGLDTGKFVILWPICKLFNPIPTKKKQCTT